MTKRRYTNGSKGSDQHGSPYVILPDSVIKKEFAVKLSEATDTSTITKLIDNGAKVVSPSEKKAYLDAIHRLANEPESFKVATQVGWLDKTFVLPDEIISGDQNTDSIIVQLDMDIDQSYYRVYRKAGKLGNWKEIPEAVRGNSRAVFHLSLQFVGPLGPIMGHIPSTYMQSGRGGSGKSSLIAAATSVFGWSPPGGGAELGTGRSLNTTRNATENFMVASNHSCVFLDEGNRQGRLAEQARFLIELAFTLDGGETKARHLSGNQLRRFEVAAIITVNPSVNELFEASGDRLESHHLDRMPDIPLPVGGTGIYETLNGHDDIPDMVRTLRSIAAANHGVAGRRYLRRLATMWQTDEAMLLRGLRDREREFLEKVPDRSGARDLTRVNASFARVYAAGCLAAHFKILPFSREEIMAAVFSCHRDHVAVNANVFGTAHVRRETAREKLTKFVSAGYTDMPLVHKTSSEMPPSDSEPPGHLFRSEGRTWILIKDAILQAAVGGKREGQLLKRKLDDDDLIFKAKAGADGTRLVVKRPVGEGGKLEYVVQIRLEAFPNIRSAVDKRVDRLLAEQKAAEVKAARAVSGAPKSGVAQSVEPAKKSTVSREEKKAATALSIKPSDLARQPRKSGAKKLSRMLDRDGGVGNLGSSSRLRGSLKQRPTSPRSPRS